ncbi:L-rhamnose mutarotase [Herbiconiux sp. A18JL235]|uniref:L-rhamnose mutarotase n=1 Tax=Herbiconiux sp. A18JL235 TaxID=3152363 RepID=A0AB39BGK7_9MICO
MTQKVCFLLRIDSEAIDEYVERHRTIWPEMLHALKECGYRNYSMFADPTGLLVGYLETDDFELSSRAMAASEVQHAWDAYMTAMFRDVDEARPVGSVVPLLHAFDLDRQLAEVVA